LHYAKGKKCANFKVVCMDNDLKLQVLRYLKKLQSKKATRKMAKDIFRYIVRLWSESSFDCWGQSVYWDIRNYNKQYNLDEVLHYLENLESRKNERPVFKRSE
jgi:hypothetical protein